MTVIIDGDRRSSPESEVPNEPSPWRHLKQPLKLLAQLGIGQIIGWLLRRWLG